MEIALERVDEMKILPSYKLKNSPVRDSEVREVAAERPTTTPIYVLLPSGVRMLYRPPVYIRVIIVKYQLLHSPVKYLSCASAYR